MYKTDDEFVSTSRSITGVQYQCAHMIAVQEYYDNMIYTRFGLRERAAALYPHVVASVVQRLLEFRRN